MSVSITWDVPRPPVDTSAPGDAAPGDAAPGDAALSEAVQAALLHGKRAGLRVDVVLVDDPTLTDLHGRFLNDPTPTDVISFDLSEDAPPGPQDPGPDAELYISLDCAQRVSLERGVSLARELTLYAVHGALHLCGFDDHEPLERAAMRVAEGRVLAGLGFEEDQGPHS